MDCFTKFGQICLNFKNSHKIGENYKSKKPYNQPKLVSTEKVIIKIVSKCQISQK